MEPSQALVTLDGLVTLVTLGGTVPFHPEMMHYLQEGREGEKRNTVQEKQDLYKQEWKPKSVFEPASFPLINHAGGVSCFNSIRWRDALILSSAAHRWSERAGWLTLQLDAPLCFSWTWRRFWCRTAARGPRSARGRCTCKLRRGREKKQNNKTRSNFRLSARKRDGTQGSF